MRKFWQRCRRHASKKKPELPRWFRFESLENRELMTISVTVTAPNIAYQQQHPGTLTFANAINLVNSNGGGSISLAVTGAIIEGSSGEINFPCNVNGGGNSLGGSFSIAGDNVIVSDFGAGSSIGVSIAGSNALVQNISGSSVSVYVTGSNAHVTNISSSTGSVNVSVTGNSAQISQISAPQGSANISGSSGSITNCSGVGFGVGVGNGTGNTIHDNVGIVGIAVDSTASNTMVLDNTVENPNNLNFSEGLSIFGNDNFVENNVVDQIKGLTAISIGGTGNQVTANKFLDGGISLGGHDNTVDTNTVGVTLAGAASQSGGISIGGHDNQVLSNQIVGGVTISGDHNLLEDNKINTDAAGMQRRFIGTLGGIGVAITGTNHLIKDNVIAGNNAPNAAAIMTITGSSTAFINVEGNKIGVDASGNGALGGTWYGIQLQDAHDIVIGGDSAAERNIIGGNRVGISIEGSFGNTNSAVNNRIANNYIGIGADGQTDLGNTGSGVNIVRIRRGNLAADTMILRIEDNVISGNGAAGINSSGSDLEIYGNKIGTNAAGTAAVANGGSGIALSRQVAGESDNLMIGKVERGNVISGNGGYGIGYTASPSVATQSSNIKIQANKIGVNAAGDAAVGNGFSGISLSGKNLQIGGQSGAAGALGEGNLISGNADRGLAVNGSSITIQGNKIGVNLAGTAALANAGSGILLAGQDIKIGSDQAGQGNLISANGGNGIEVYGKDTKSIQIAGNRIGLKSTDDGGLGNQRSGIYISDQASEVTIGGTTAQRNWISYNGKYGILISNSDDIDVQNNFVGYIAGQETQPGNIGGGVAIIDQALHDTVSGSPLSSSRDDIKDNVITGHVVGLNGAAAFGIAVRGTGDVVPGELQISGNKIGVNEYTEHTGEGFDNQIGVLLFDATGVTIGGDSTGERNYLAGGSLANIAVQGSLDVTIKGNWLGLDDASSPNHSPGMGISIIDSSRVAIKGGDGHDNIIAYHDGDGINIAGKSSLISITQNSIYSNGGLGIRLSGLMDQEGVHPVLGSLQTSNGNSDVSGWLIGAKPNTKYNLQFYTSETRDPSGFGEGQTYAGSVEVVTNLLGFVDFNYRLNGIPANLSATATQYIHGSVLKTTFDFSATIDDQSVRTAVTLSVDTLGQLTRRLTATIHNLLPHAKASLFAAADEAADAGDVPTGKVIFYDGNQRLGEATIDVNGVAKFDTPSLASGSHRFRAVYEGDLNFSGTASNEFTTTIKGTALGVDAGQGGFDADDEGRGVVVDASGNSYVIGTTYFADGAADSTTTQNGDILLAKYDRYGSLIWQQVIGDVGDDRGLGIARDSSGNLYITGMFQGTVNFNPGSTAKNLTSRGGFDIFVASFTSNGSYRWAQSYGNTSTASSDADVGYGIAVSSDNKVLVTGQFAGTVDFDASSKTLNLKSVGATDIFVMRLSSGGSFSWAKQIGGSGADRGTGIITDASKRVYVVGSFTGKVDFDPSSSTKSLTSAGGKDAFLLRLSSTGSYSYARAFGGKSDDEAHGVVVDPSNNVYLTGYFAGTADLDPGSSKHTVKSAGSNDVFIVKLNSSGNYSFGNSVGGSGDDRGRGIVRQSNGNIAIVGNFSGTADFNPSSTVKNVTSHGSDDAFVLRLSSSGSYKAVTAIGGTGSDRGRAIAVDSKDKLYAIGQFFETLGLNTGEGTVNLTSKGGKDLFLVRLA